MNFAVVLDADRFAPERLRLMAMADLRGWAERRQETLRSLAPFYPHHRVIWTRELEAMEAEMQRRTAAPPTPAPSGEQLPLFP
jgi:hypothetical protein